MTDRKTAEIYRMVMATHTCPYGLKALDLLKRKGYAVDDRHLTTREETDAFKAQHHVETTPQVFIKEKRVGGYDDLRRFFGLTVRDKNAVTYRPVIALFAMAAAMALAASWAAYGAMATVAAAEWFIAIAMCRGRLREGAESYAKLAQIAGARSYLLLPSTVAPERRRLSSIRRWLRILKVSGPTRRYSMKPRERQNRSAASFASSTANRISVAPLAAAQLSTVE